MPSGLTLELRTALLASETIRTKLLANEEQCAKYTIEIEEANAAIATNNEEIKSLEERLIDESKRFSEQSLKLETLTGEERERLVKVVEKINEDNESLKLKLAELPEKNKTLEQKLMELTQKIEDLSSSNEQMEQSKKENRKQIECLVEAAKKFEECNLISLTIEYDHYEKEIRNYLLDISNDFEIFELLFDHFMQTNLLNNEKKADVFAEVLTRFIALNQTRFVDYLLEIYHCNRSVFSLDREVTNWHWTLTVNKEKCSYKQALTATIVKMNTTEAIHLLCYGAKPELTTFAYREATYRNLDSNIRQFDEKNQTDFSALIQANADLKSGIQYLNESSRIKAIAKIASAINLYPTFVSQYIKTQFHFAMLQAKAEVSGDETDYRFLLGLLDLCAYICYEEQGVENFKELIQMDILPHVIDYPVVDSEKALFKNQKGINAFLEREYIKQLYTTSSWFSTMNNLAKEEEPTSTQTPHSFFSPSSTDRSEPESSASNDKKSSKSSCRTQ